MIRKMAVRLPWLLIALFGCKPVYDAQYDTRATELEAFRSDFQPGTEQVSFLTSSGNKVFWVSVVLPSNMPLLHSFDPATGAQLDYTFSMGNHSIAQNFQMSDTLIVNCDFEEATAFDATLPNHQIDMITSGGSNECAVAGNDVYFFIGHILNKWTPGAGVSNLVVDLSSMFESGTTIGGFGLASPNTLLVNEGPHLWLIDTGTHAATWLHNPDAESGLIAFDGTGVVYNTQNGPTYSRYADQSTLDLTAAIADGGYDLNFEHSDIQDIGDVDDYVVHEDHLIYRSKSGIFAYGFTTKKVVDLLLDRNPGSFDTKPLYRTPSPVGDTLFVQDLSESGDHPVYKVDLTGRLR